MTSFPWQRLLPLALAAFLVACGGSESSDEASGETPSPTGEDAAAAVTEVPARDVPGTEEAWVNGTPIYAAEVTMVQGNLTTQGYPPDTTVSGDTPEERMHNTALKMLVDQRLLLDGARSAGIEASKVEIDAKMAQAMGQVGGPTGLASMGLTEETLRTDIERNILVRNYVTGKVTPEVTDAEVDSYLKTNPPEEVRARHILIFLQGETDDMKEAEVRSRMLAIKKEIADGKPFEQAAAEYSEDTTTKQAGGELGWFGRGRMVPPFEQAAFALEPGEISDPVRSNFGYHLIQLEERREVPREQAVSQARAFLQQKEMVDGTQALIDSLRAAGEVRYP